MTPEILAEPSSNVELYDASRITILDPSEAAQRFPFALAAELAVRYPTTAPDFIERLVESCRLTGFSLELATRRYLGRNSAVTQEASESEWETLRACHLELVRKRYQP